jgi:hypothetical protein
MKKILVSILAVFYLASSVGATVHLHYCMDKLINWSLLKGDGDKCDKCGMKKDDGCCKDEHKFVKNSDDQKAAESSIEVLQFLTGTAPVSVLNISEFYSSIVHKYPVSHAPPTSGREFILAIAFSVFKR